MEEVKKVDLDAPAFGIGAKSADDTSETTTEISQIKELGQDDAESVTRKLEGEAPAEESEEEQKIPYSRFKTIADQKRQAEEDAREANERYENLRAQREERIEEAKKPEDEKLLGYMIKLYGDNENTREAYKVELERLAYVEKRAEDRAIESVREYRENETRSLAKNEETIDNNLEDLQEYVGRKLTEAEQSGILEIVDEYTPKDADGNYSGDLLPFDKAFEIYELKNQSKAQSSKRARSSATALTGRGTDGEPSGTAKSNSDFNPLNWNSYQNRI